MNRDSSRCVARSNVSCGTDHESYTPNNIGHSDVLAILNRVVEHTLRHGLSTVHDRTYFAVVDLYQGDVESARLRLTIVLPACDDRSKSLIRDALQLLEAFDGGEA